MALQGDNPVMVGMGIVGDSPPNSIQPPLADGIHLRWAFRPSLGFPPHGFHLFRRPHKEAKPRCLSKLIGNMRADLEVGDELDIPTFGRISSDRSIELTHYFRPGEPVGFGLYEREFLRVTLSHENLARRVEVHIAFLQDAEIRVTARSADAAVLARALVSGQAWEIKSFHLEADAISIIELAQGLAVLADICFVPVSLNATTGWGLVPDFTYPMCLPLTHPDYPCNGWRDEDLAAARVAATERVLYGDPNEPTDVAARLTERGTVTLANGSPIVLGDGTSWGDELVGGVLRVEGDRTGYTVVAIIGPEKMVLSRPYTGASASRLAYAVDDDPFGQLHDYLVHLVAGGSAAGAMINRSLPSPIVTGGVVKVVVGSAEVTGIGTAWGEELKGLALQVVRDNRGNLNVEHGSSLVNGIGTAWGLELTGLFLQVEGERAAYTIVGVEPDGQRLVLDRSYQGSAAWGSAYEIVEKTNYTIARVESPTRLRFDREYHANAERGTTYTLAYAIRARQQPMGSGGDAPAMSRQYPLDMVLLAALQPAAAQMLGLYWVDRAVSPGTAYDYLIVADYVGRFKHNSLEVLRQLADDGFTDIDGYITFNRRADPAEPLTPPDHVRAFALPGLSAPAGSASNGRPHDAPHLVGLRWETSTEWWAFRSGHAVMYHVWRAKLGNGEKPASAALHKLITDGRPVLTAGPAAAHLRTPAPPPDWPPFPLHFLDQRLTDGWYGYQLSGIDIFGRHSSNSDAAWHQWTPAPEPRPWYYEDALGAGVVHPAAVRLLDKTGPPAPTGVEAFALDPADPHVRRDRAYTTWRESNRDVVGLRVRWLWTHAHAQEAPDTNEFRIYYQPGQMNAWTGRTLRVTVNSETESTVETDIVNTRPADACAGAQLRCGPATFPVLGNDAGNPLRLRVGHLGPFYRVGTIELTHDSPIVTGSGTNWGPELAGLMLRPEGAAEPYTILRVETPTRLILERAYAGGGGAGAGYFIVGLMPLANTLCTLALPSPHTAGTVMVTNGSPVVIGANTNWRANLVRFLMRVGAGETVYGIARVDSETRLTLDRAYEGRNSHESAYSVRHPLFVDYSAPNAWRQRIHAVGYDEHVTEVTDAAVTAGGPPVRRYEVFLPAPDTMEGQPFAPSPADPLVYAHIGVSAADDKTYTPDERRSADRWGGRPGNEGSVGPSATVFRVRRERPPAPVAPPDAERVFATAADYHGRSFYTYRWRRQAHLQTHIFRALDSSVFQTDWLLRTTRASLNPASRPHETLFPNEPDLLPDGKQTAARQLNSIASAADYDSLSAYARTVLARLPGNGGAREWPALRARDWLIRRTRTSLDAEDVAYFPREWQEPDDEANRLKRRTIAAELSRVNSSDSYHTLSDDALRVLAGLPGNEAAFTQVTLQPLDPDDPANFDRRGPDTPDTYTPDPALGSYTDTLDGRSANRYFYRAAYADGAHNRGAPSLSSPPVYLPDVVPPRTPLIARVFAGTGVITLQWVSNREADLAEYQVYRATSGEAARDLRLMSLVHTVPALESAEDRPREVVWDDVDVTAGRSYWYRIAAVDTARNSSTATNAVEAQTWRLSPPLPPDWEFARWRADGAAIQLQWALSEPGLEYLIQRRVGTSSRWVTVSGWLGRDATSFTDTSADPAAENYYRIKSRDGGGNTSVNFIQRLVSPRG